jgi:hypothetical protein
MMETSERSASTHRRTAFQEERARLFDRPRKTSQSSTANDAAGLQESLARTHRLLAQELERVSHVASAIEHDGKILDQTMSHHQTMNVIQAKKALTALEREQQKEQRILLASIIFFWCVVAYVLWGRILTHVPLFDRTVQLLTRLVEFPLRKAMELSKSSHKIRHAEL